MQLTVIERNGQFAVDSREVAEMTDKKHCDLLRDIRNYIETLDKSENAKLLSRNFFIPSTYTTQGNFSNWIEDDKREIEEIERRYCRKGEN